MQISRTKLQVPAAWKCVKNVVILKKNSENKWQLTWKQQIKNYNKRHITWKYYVKNKIWFNVKNICSIKLLKKLNYKFLKFFEIIKLIEFKTYILRLFKIMRDIHFIFHMFLFELGWPSDRFRKNQFRSDGFKNSKWKFDGSPIA